MFDLCLDAGLVVLRNVQPVLQLHDAQAPAGVICFCSPVVLALAVKQQYQNFWI